MFPPQRSTRSTTIYTSSNEEEEEEKRESEKDAFDRSNRSRETLPQDKVGGDQPSVSDVDNDHDNDDTNSREVSKIRHYRNLAGAIVNDEYVQLAIVGLIVINAIMMGISTFAFVTDNPDVTNAFEITDQIFLIIFTIELAFQFLYHGLKLFTDGWLIFDFIVILLSWSLSSLQVVRTFRVFRALRLITRVQTLKNLVSALFAVGPRISVIGALLLLVLYIYAVMCTVLFKDLYERGVTDNDYFGRLDVTFWTLFIMITLDWANVARQVMAVHSWAWVIFVSFVMLTSFIVYNLIIAVVCDSLSMIDSEESDAEEAAKKATEVANLTQTRELRQRIDILAKEQQDTLHALSAVLSSQYGVDLVLAPPSGWTASLPTTKQEGKPKVNNDTKPFAA
eukprot:CAMPEP_0194052228 /NCGR_PEP_ID=MMETSP0009_2-20130614/44575_1 /TAXON_ID=210454 /ORGANISM="Grammatophora oceanica, Strain CCMP 410" /LENGTH=393 /DNA_ID=CAMNT_0038699721 /DNA_START=190 /DNA_END=1371 /DNA_ORIENTATION=-